MIIEITFRNNNTLAFKDVEVLTFTTHGLELLCHNNEPHAIGHEYTSTYILYENIKGIRRKA